MSNRKISTTPKRGDIWGFDGGEETERRKKLWMKNQVECQWRRVTKIRFEYTYLYRRWTLPNQNDSRDDEHFTDKMICPWGMVSEAKKNLLNKKVLNDYSTIPLDVKNHFGDLLNSNNMKTLMIDIDDEGSKGFAEFHYLYCINCTKDILPNFLEEYKDFLPANATIEDVLANWDKCQT